MQEDLPKPEPSSADVDLLEASVATSGQFPAAVLVLLCLVISALALKLALSSARDSVHADTWRARGAGLFPGVLGLGLGLWAAGLLGVIGLERVKPLGFDPQLAGALFGVALLAAVPPLLLLSSRGSPLPWLRLLGGSAVLLTAGSMLVSLGWLHAARLEPLPALQPLRAVMGALVAVAGLTAALAVARPGSRDSGALRRLRRMAAALGGGLALTLGQMLVHEGVLLADKTSSDGTASLPVGLLSGLGGLVPMVLLGLIVAQRLQRQAQAEGGGASGAASARRSRRRTRIQDRVL